MQPKRFLRFFALGFVSATAVFWGCGVTPTNNSSGNDEPTAGRVFVIEDSNGSGDVEIVRIPASQQHPAIGDVLVGTSGNGFLRRAESVSAQPDGTLSVETSQATIAQAAREGDFAFTDGLPNGKESVQTKRYEVFQLSTSLARTLYSSNGVTVSTSGDFALDLTIDLEMQVRGAKMELFRAAIEGTASIELNGDIEALAGASFEREVSLLGEPRRKYLYGVIGGIPVVIVVTADVLAGASGSMNGSATLTTGVGASSFVRVGAEYSSDRWSVIADEGLDYGYTGPVWCVQGELGAKVYIRPVIELQLYGVLGPKFDLEPYLEYSADASACGGAGLEPTSGYDWELAGGLAAHAKVKVDILDRFMIESPTLTVFDLRWILAEGHGDTPPTDFDGDGVPDGQDGCPHDPDKTSPGQCGCGKVDTPNCGQPMDNCPSDPNKTEPGLCGCGVPDTDSDGDGTPDCHDTCPNDPNKTIPGQCGCGKVDAPNCGQPVDNCPSDPNKTNPGLCGCGVPDTDSDGDGTPNCRDSCPGDPNKTAPGQCGCGVAEGTCGAGTTDLALTGLSVMPSSGSSRTFTGCSFNIINNGPTALSSEGIFAEYYLSDDTTFGDGDDRKIGDTGFTVSIASGATYPINLSPTGLSNMTRNWTAGLVPNGSYYVYAKVQISDGSPSDPTSANDYGRTSGTISYSGEGDQSNSCPYAHDGECDDGRPGSITSACDCGTDSADCDELQSNSCQYAFDGECDDGRLDSVTSLCACGTDSADCEGLGDGAFADFSQPTITGTISISVGQSFRWNDFYRTWRIESSGGGFTGSFNSPSGGAYQLVVDHTSSASSGCQGGGFSPVTIRVNGTTVANCWDPAANNGGSHGSVTDEWTVSLNAGTNTIEWTACNLCTHYWIRKVEIR